MASNTKPVNPWQTTLDFVFDIESTNVGGRHIIPAKYGSGGEYIPTPDVGQVDDMFMHADLVQFGYKTKGGKRKQAVFTGVHSTVDLRPIDKERDVTLEVFGKKSKGKAYTAVLYDKDDILEYGKQALKQNKLSSQEYKYYEKYIAPQAYRKAHTQVYKIQGEDGRDITLSEFSHKGYFKEAKGEATDKIRKTYNLTDDVFKEMPLNTFYNGKGEDTLHEIINSFLDGATPQTPKTMGAWNAQFDVEFIRNVIRRSGNAELSLRFEGALKSGAIKVIGQERDWMLIAYRLVKENPQLAENFKVGYHPTAFVETGGRSGQTARNIKEFQYALPWKESRLMDYFSWYKPLQEVTKGLPESHHALPDTEAAEKLTELFNKIKSRAYEIAAGKNIELDPNDFTKFATSNNVGEEGSIIEQAIVDLMGDRTISTVSNPKQAMKHLKDTISKDAKAMSSWSKGLYPSYMSAKLNGMNKKRLVQYGSIAVAAASLLAMTYLAGGKETEVSPDGSINLDRKKKFKGLNDRYVEGKQGPNYPSLLLTKVLPGFAIPIGAAFTVGTLSAIKAGKPLGVRKKTEDSVFGYATEILKTMRRGVREIESAIPVTRLFRVGALTNYLLGDRNIGPVKGAEDVSKSLRFYTVKGGKITNWKDRFYLDPLLDAMKITNPKEAEELNEILSYSSGYNKKLDKTIIRITRNKAGKVIVHADSIDRVAINSSVKPAKISRSWEFDLEAVRVSTKATSLQNRTGRVQDPFVRGYIHEDAFSRGNVKKVEFSTYFNRRLKEGAIKPEGFLGDLYKGFEYMRWKLDLASKGISETSSRLYPELERLQKDVFVGKNINGKPIMKPITTVIPTAMKGAHRWSKEDIGLRWKYYKQIFKEWPIPSTSMSKFFETPFEVIGIHPEWMEKKATELRKSSSILSRGAGRTLSFMNRPYFGLQIEAMKYGTPQFFAEFGMKRLLPAYLAFEALRFTDHVLGKATFSEDGRGPLTKIPLKAYEWGSLAYSKVSDILGLTAIAKKQEKIAPGSTGLGVFAPSMTAAAFFAVSKGIYKHAPKSFQNQVDAMGRRIAEVPLIKRALRPEAFKGALNKSTTERYISWAVKNPKLAIFSFAMLPAPFLFGAIGSNKSYAERKAEFQGKRDVAIRKYRGWLLSTSPFEGGKPIQFRRHAANLIESDWENKVIWPSYWHRAAHNLTGGLLGRYMLEKYHAKDQPVYESAPYGVNIPLLGPAIAGTIGKIIKPRQQYHMPPENITRSFINNSMGIASKTYTGIGYDTGGFDSPGGTPGGGSGGKGKGSPTADGMMARVAKVGFEAAGGETAVISTGLQAIGLGGATGSVLQARRLSTSASRVMWMLHSTDYADNRRYKDFKRDLGVESPHRETYNDNDSFNISSEHSYKAMSHVFGRSFAELSGFKGFTMQTIGEYVTGKRTVDEFTPYLQSAKQMYNSSNQMWQYQGGDVSVFGGEFLRRIMQNPEKKWEINDIPNELQGTTWIPKKFQYGTTFDKVPMGWLYASKRGWEQLFPEVKGMDLEEYPDPIRLEILKQLAPQSSEYSVTSEKVMNLALSNKLAPMAEQRYYETLSQVRQLKEQVYAHSANFAYGIGTDKMSGTVTSLDLEQGTFTIDSQRDRKFRLAGITLNSADIRDRLLQTKSFDSAKELDDEAARIKENMQRSILEHMNVGENISFQAPEEGSFSGLDKATEAIVGSLNNNLLKEGAPLADTGNLAMFNMQQDRAGMAYRAMAKYWEMVTAPNTLWNKKLIGNRDYLKNYYASQVYNREVKLWSHPIKHILEPFVASVMQNVGIDYIPSFTRERRANQQYWDVIKYVKYKMLAVKAQEEGDSEEAEFYHKLWRQTMVGADPTGSSTKDELMALPSNERGYFEFFANEPDPKKRAKIFKSLPAPAKRLYNAIWMKQIASNSQDPKIQDAYERLKESEGYVLSEEEEEKQYEEEASDRVSKADWARARFIQKYAEEHHLPGDNWAGWQPQVDLENVEVSALREQGEQIQDYGYFDNAARQAAYDGPAYQAAMTLKSKSLTAATLTGSIIPVLASNDRVKDAYSMPTTSIMPMSNNYIETNDHEKTVMKANNGTFVHLIDDAFILTGRFLRI